VARLELNNSLLAVIDVQGKLAHLVHEKESLHLNLQRLIKGATILGIPILWAEQNPAGLGPTIPEIAGLLSTEAPIPKMSFSCVGCKEFAAKLASYQRKQIIVAGIETHVCVFQTVSDLLQQGYEAHVMVDAVSSRLSANKQAGLDRMKTEGAILSSTEMALFELLQTAESARFKEIIKVLK
jgi:hypothetical protein